MSPLNKTITLISGANQGIGLAAAQILARKNHHVIIGSRVLESGHKAASALVAEGLSAEAVQLDIQSDTSIAAATAYIQKTYGRIDVLINNAGIQIDTKAANMTRREMYDTTFSTNVAGTACLTDALLPLIRASTQKPRVIFVSTCMGSVAISADATTAWYKLDYRAYDASKAAINVLMLNYNRILADKGARVNSVCPGLVSSNLTGYMAAGTTTEVGAQRIVELATFTGNDSDVTGTFSNRDGSLPW